VIGILILTHGELANGFLSALKLISGNERQIEGIGLFHETDIEEYKEAVTEKIKDMDQGEGILVFCDIFGASPYNVTAQNFKNLKDVVHYRAVTGVSLPMIIEAVYCRKNMALDVLAQHVQQMGKDGIKELFDTIKRSETNE